MKDLPMKLSVIAFVLMSGMALQSTAALEATAVAKDVKESSPDIAIGTERALLQGAITKVNQDLMAVLRCNNQNMFYKPKDSTADPDGCVGATITTSTLTKTVNLPVVEFDSYPGHTKGSKGFKGTSTRHINLSSLVADGATAISIKATRSSNSNTAWGSCGGAVTLNIANVNSNYKTTTLECHYDSSPNRRHEFKWSYDSSGRSLAVQSLLSQTSKLRTDAKLTGITATYTVTKTVLKVGDGK